MNGGPKNQFSMSLCIVITEKTPVNKKVLTFFSIKARQECYKLNNQGTNGAHIIILEFYICLWNSSTYERNF